MPRNRSSQSNPKYLLNSLLNFYSESGNPKILIKFHATILNFVVDNEIFNNFNFLTADIILHISCNLYYLDANDSQFSTISISSLR